MGEGGRIPGEEWDGVDSEAETPGCEAWKSAQKSTPHPSCCKFSLALGLRNGHKMGCTARSKWRWQVTREREDAGWGEGGD